MLSRERAGSEDGFSLIELVISIAVLGLVGGAISGSFLVMLGTKTRTESALAVSRDRQFVATYLTDDVTDAAALGTGGHVVCGSTLSTVLLFTSTDFDAGSTSPVAVQVAWTHDAGAKTLVRTACRGGAPAVTTTVARNVPSAPTVSASCSSAVGLTTTSREVALTVPQSDGVDLRLCARRRPE